MDSRHEILSYWLYPVRSLSSVSSCPPLPTTAPPLHQAVFQDGLFIGTPEIIPIYHCVRLVSLDSVLGMSLSSPLQCHV